MPMATPPGEFAVILPLFAMPPETVPGMDEELADVAPTTMPPAIFTPFAVIVPELLMAPEIEPTLKMPATLVPLSVILPLLSTLPVTVPKAFDIPVA